MSDGTIRSMGNMEFRVRRVPEPTILYGALTSGEYTPGQIMAQNYMQMYLQNFFFQGVKYTLVSYGITVQTKTGQKKLNEIVNGTQRIKKVKIEPGDKIIVGNFQYKGPDGQVRRKKDNILLYAK